MMTSSQQEKVIKYFEGLQLQLIEAFESADGSSKASVKEWQRPAGGGGKMGVLRGDVVEKAGANMSIVHGEKYPSIESEYAGQPFFATGVSTIGHMFNPHAPIGHMNVRMLKVADTFWFGGGADLTPFLEYQEDTDLFHETLKEACDKYSSDAYEKFSKWCKEYFHIKHRNSERGVGGVFFDYLKDDFDRGFAFVQAVSQAYIKAYFEIINRRKNLEYTEQQKKDQLYWRGRYVEFNLLYDRGTRFGLMTGGNIEAIFVSLPPMVSW